MLRQIAAYVKDRRGQSLVEFSLVLPVFILLLAGMIDFGRVFNVLLTVTDAAREGARSAAVGSNDAVVAAAVKGAASSLDPTKFTITIDPNPTRTTGNSVTVTVSYPVQISTPVAAIFPQNPYIVQGTATMRVE